MKKHIRMALLVIGKIILILLFIASFYAVGILDLWLVGIPIYWLLIPLTVLIIYPLIEKYLPKKWKRLQKLGVTIISYLFFLLIFQGINTFIDYGRDRDVFNYRFGNTLGPLKFIAQNPLGQQTLRKIYGFLPFTSQMIVLALEDTNRCFKIRKTFVPGRGLKRFCPKLDSPECFIDIYKKSSIRSPYGSSGEILFMAIGAMVVKNWKKNLKDDATDTDKNYVMLKGALYIAELQLEISKSINDKNRIKSDFINFPISKLQNLPSSFLEELKKISDDEDNTSTIITNAYEKMGDARDKIGPNIVELYLAKRLNDSILKKFQKVGYERVKTLLRGVKEKLKNKATKLKNSDRKELQSHFQKITKL